MPSVEANRGSDFLSGARAPLPPAQVGEEEGESIRPPPSACPCPGRHVDALSRELVMNSDHCGRPVNLSSD